MEHSKTRKETFLFSKHTFFNNANGKKCNMKSFWKHKQHRIITVKNLYYTKQMLLVEKKPNFNPFLVLLNFISCTPWETWTSKMKPSQLTANHQKEPPQPEYLQALGHTVMRNREQKTKLVIFKRKLKKIKKFSLHHFMRYRDEIWEEKEASRFSEKTTSINAVLWGK